MKRITSNLIFSAIVVMSLTNCENKKSENGEAEKHPELEVTNSVTNIVEENVDSDSNLIYDSYSFAEKLKGDNFFESENLDKVIELKDIGIVSYFISGNEVSISGVCYDKQKNMAIPYNNRPPGGGAFVTQYYDKLEINYNEDYKRTYSVGLNITLADPKSVKKLKMYLANESSRVFEYKVDGGGLEPEYRMGFIDLVNIKGTFTGFSSMSSYPEKIYNIENAVIN
ncbi:hypothetical protein QO200_17095 [Flavobacterium sp. Arc3]|uniref:hypothetical protein n=1 Tax=Flavobacterium sp. Arc3 TaxID=3046686 RepID=UPI00352F9F91